MTSFDLISMAVRNLWKRKLRTFLTVLGVVIGTAAIIVMVSLGIGMTESFEQQLSQMGDLTVIEVNKPWSNNGMDTLVLDEKKINEFKDIEGVEAVTPIMQMYLRFVSGKNVAELNVKGIDPSTMEAFGYKISEGRLLKEGDTLNIVFGGEASQEFYNPKVSWRTRYGGGSYKPPEINLMTDKVEMSYDYNFGQKNNGQKSKVKPYKLSVVGILQGGNRNSYSSYMPITQLQKIQKDQEKYEKSLNTSGVSNRNNTKKGYDSASVKCKDINVVQKILDQIKGMGFEAYSLTEQLNAMKETSASMQALLGAIGAVSLFVAAIGITNTMVMSIYERTREIGVMKVIGAAIKDIKRLFLIEAALIGFIGGLFGVAISLILSNLLNSSGMQLLGGMMGGGGAAGSKISSIPPWLCLAALLFSALIGIISGYFPARRAMKLSAISAIRTE